VDRGMARRIETEEEITEPELETRRYSGMRITYVIVDPPLMLAARTVV